MGYNRITIGSKVRVISTDNTELLLFIQTEGVIIKAYTGTSTEGLNIGETEDDPLWLVEFPNKRTGIFWTEELEKIKT